MDSSYGLFFFLLFSFTQQNKSQATKKKKDLLEQQQELSGHGRSEASKDVGVSFERTIATERRR